MYVLLLTGVAEKMVMAMEIPDYCWEEKQ